MTVPPSTATEAALATDAKILTVDFENAAPTPPYDIVVGDGILNDIATLIRERLGQRRCILISDSIVDPLYRTRLEALLTAGGHEVLTALILPAGEPHKTFATLQPLLQEILNAGIDRKTLIIALGGGVVGDMAGLAASLALRGLDLVQIPTTLLAQVDSSIGGKTGIDTAYGKNTVGTFYQPRLVVADVSALDSLPAREMQAGYAEVFKYGLIGNDTFFRWCVAHGGQILNGDHDAQVHAVMTSCAAKIRIIADDERETGERALLNFGHTFGHALEAATGFGTLLVHGEAVAIGMTMAFRLSVMLGLCPQSDYEEARRHMQTVGLPVTPPPFDYDIDLLMKFMAQDKKAQGGKITLVLTRGIGKCFIQPHTDERQIRALWEEFIRL